MKILGTLIVLAVLVGTPIIGGSLLAFIDIPSMLFVGLIVLGIAFFQPPSIMIITYFAGTLFASSWGPVAFMSVWSKSITANAAFWGIVTGFLGNIIPKTLDIMGVLTLPVYLDPCIIGLTASLATILVVSRFGQITAEERVFLEELHVTPKAEYNPQWLKRSLTVCHSMIVGGVCLLLVLWFFYVTPYHEALSKKNGISTTAGFSTKVLSGEFIQSLLYSSSLIICGVLAAYCLKRTYRSPDDPVVEQGS